MSVHIGEVHTDLVPVGGGPGPAAAGGQGGPGGPVKEAELAERLCDALHRMGRLAARVAAEGFDD
ncbi:hypothetical protein ACIBCA_03350 [Kitasatospora sp. NPDC051170]|uniref:hypothetical protein n=1 Tax=Kitasatospora sp. NPDC051170 TaxID=3364056 RepID=UPI00378FF6E5